MKTLASYSARITRTLGRGLLGRVLAWTFLLCVPALVIAQSTTTAPTTASQPASVPATSTAPAVEKKEAPKKAATAWVKNDKLVSHVTVDSTTAEINRIFAMGPRAVGQTGHTRVRQYIRDELAKLKATDASGKFDVREQHFYATVPLDVRTAPDGSTQDINATLTIGDLTLRPAAMYPNVVAPSYFGGEGITAPIIDGGDGSLRNLDGKKVKDSIVLLRFNSDKNWENAAKLGAKAILFRHPETTTSAQATKKFFLIPLELPRYLLSEEETQKLSALLEAAPADKPVTGVLKGGTTWQEVKTSNILALIPGSDPDPKKAANLFIIQVYVDSMSIAPASPHGADTSLQLVAGLNILRAMMADPSTRPACSVLFAFTDAHSQALQGSRELAYVFWRHAEQVKNPSRVSLESDAKAALAELNAHKEALNFIASTSAAAPTKLAADVLNKRIEALASRRSIITAKALQDAQRVKSPDAETLAYLQSVRDWYSKIKYMTDATERVRTLQKGSPVYAKGDRFNSLSASVADLSSELSQLIEQLSHASLTAQSNAEIAAWLFTGRANARMQGLFLELAPGADQVSWAGISNFGLDNVGQKLFPNMHAAHAPIAQQMAKDLGLTQLEPLDDAFSIAATTQRGKTLSPMVPESTPMVLAGVPSFGLVAMDAGRSYLETPLDTPNTIDYPRAADTMRFLCAFVPWLSNDLSVISVEPRGRAGGVNLSGRVVKYDLLAGVSPNEPVPDALAYYPLNWLPLGPDNQRTVAGVRFAAVQKVNLLGQYAIRMIPDSQAKKTRKETPLYGFRLDSNGSIDFALDLSAQGAELLRNTTQRIRAEDQVAIVIAPARAVAVFDLTDPRTLTTITDLRVLTAATLNKLDSWSFYFTKENGFDSAPAGSIEDCGIIFAPEKARIVAMASAGLSGTRATYLNVQEGKGKDGKRTLVTEGFVVEKTPRILFSALQVASDMVLTNEDRLSVMQAQGIRDELLAKLTEESRKSLNNAKQHYAEQRYSDAYREATHSWGVALRAYTPVRNLGKDAVIGSVFFMALCLPFAFFMERLTIRAKNPNWRVIWTILWFSAIFGILFLIHPAFKISLNPMIVLLAFVMIVLVVVVATIVYRKFVILIREYRNQLEGVHGADLKRFSAGGVALNLSLSTMARRKARTVLTAATLTMLAFAIVTFSSVASRISSSTVPISGVTPSYSGIMFRMPNWVDMPSSVVSSFVDEFGEKSVVLPRMWKLRTQDPWALGAGSANTTMLLRKPAETSATQPAKKKAPDISVKIKGVIGVTPQEAELFDVKSMLTAGTWLREGHREDILLPPSAAAELKIKPEDLGTPKARVFIMEQWFTVVGILNPENLDKWTDLDGENFAPADYASAGIVGQGSSTNTDLANLPTIDVTHRTPHLSYSDIVITTIDRTKLLQGVYKGVAVKFGKDVNPREALDRLLLRLRIPIFAGFVEADPSKSVAALYASQDSPDPKGFGKLIIPVILAIFMIVNTLLGTVEERKDEIGMLNSVGLAPAHVGMLFLVEAVVYGVIGLVVGYMLGLLLAKLLLGNAAFALAIGAAGVSLNYSSGGTIISCLLVLVIVVLSALYPARQARRMATPGAMARWALPESDTGDISIEVPFTLTGGNALGMIGFLDEYLAQHTDSTSPDFRVIHKYLTEHVGPHGKPEILLAGDAYLAPYDLGVSNTFQICVRSTDEPNILRVRFAISRLGGDMNSYRRATQKFLDLLRRQFLIWRTLEPVEKQKYVSRTLANVADTPPSDTAVPVPA